MRLDRFGDEGLQRASSITAVRLARRLAALVNRHCCEAPRATTEGRQPIEADIERFRLYQRTDMKRDVDQDAGFAIAKTDECYVHVAFWG
jgi:hypothetical protein